MTPNEFRVAEVLSVKEHLHDNKRLCFEGLKFRLEDNEHTVVGTFTVKIRGDRCFIITSPDIGNIEVELMLK